MITDKKFEILDWFIISTAFVVGLFTISAIKSSLNYIDDDGGSESLILTATFIIGLLQIGLLISPWSIKSSNANFKVLTAVSMLPGFAIALFLFIDSVKSIFDFGFMSSYSRNSVFALLIILLVLSLYGIQIIRLLRVSGKKIKFFDS